ncbi:MAG TPA: glycosyltransferase family 2 protein [Solirubrobacteraceae bacterium]|nr:glycosyltransferase family 2 protein [Solirubrobacteraceae bacterium]
MTADVVIVTFNSGDAVVRCLELLGDAPAIIVDNASTDGTPDRIAERFPDARLVRNADNVGFGRAVNQGAALGEGSAIVLLNDDVEPEPGFVAALLEQLERDERVGMVAGLLLMPGGEVVDGFGVEADPTLAVYNRLRGRSPEETPGRLLGPSGGAAAYRRSAWDQAGGFDERLFAYGEDVDLALRLRGAGWTAVAAPGARGIHLGGRSFGVDSPLQRRLGGVARGFLLRRWSVLRSRAAGRALAHEALVVGWGLVRHRSLIPLTARIEGWRLASGGRHVLPPDAVDERIGFAESLRRLRSAR